MISLCVSRNLLLHFKHAITALQLHDVDIVTGCSMIKTIKETLSNVSQTILNCHCMIPLPFDAWTNEGN